MGYRNEFSETLRKARALFPPGATDYRPERSLYGSEINEKFKQVQLPPEEGTNNGMPISLLVVRLFNLNFLIDHSVDRLREWFISCLEQRNFTLFNQSIAERRM